jgi:hypothetical protein
MAFLMAIIVLGVLGYVIGKDPLVTEVSHRQGKCE